MKNKEQKKENDKLINDNNELNDKIKEIKTYEEIIKERDNIKDLYEKLNKKYNETISKYESQIKTMNEIFINNNNNINNSNIQIKDLNNHINKIKEEKNLLLIQLNDILSENQELSMEYQNNLSKLKQNYIINSEINNEINDYDLEDVINPKSLSDFLNKCVDEIIKLNNDNYNLKNNLNNIHLQNDINSKQNNDYKIINDRLKKIIENYSKELDNKNIILNQLNIEKNQIENYIKKIDNDKQYILTILLRVCKILSNSDMYNLLNEMMTNKNLNINEKEKINIQILNEIKNCENYVKQLKENEMRMNYINKNTNIYNDIINKNDEYSNYMNEINSNWMDKIYIKKNIYNNEFKSEGMNKYK